MAIKKDDAKAHNHIVCIDFETGGLDAQKCAITEVGAMCFRADTFETLWTYQAYIKPFYTKKTKAKALKSKKRIQEELFNEDGFSYDWPMMKEKTNITQELLERKGKDIKVVAKELEELCKKGKDRSKKPILLGQNIGFDIGFLQQMGDVSGVDFSKSLEGKKDYYGNFQPEYVDTLRQAYLHFAQDEDVTMHKLGRIAELLEIELIEAHSAMDDVYGAADIFKVFINRMRNGNNVAANVKKEKVRQHFKF